MSTDRELLALAAKAARIQLSWGEKYTIGAEEFDCTDLPYATFESNDESPQYWNPLNDDGDALRLAVRLDFCITQWRNHSEYPPHVMVGYKTGPKSGSNWIQEYEGDEMAANRRAIVCAAAEIGKAIP